MQVIASTVTEAITRAIELGVAVSLYCGSTEAQMSALGGLHTDGRLIGVDPGEVIEDEAELSKGDWVVITDTREGVEVVIHLHVGESPLISKPEPPPGLNTRPPTGATR